MISLCLAFLRNPASHLKAHTSLHMYPMQSGNGQPAINAHCHVVETIEVSTNVLDAQRLSFTGYVQFPILQTPSNAFLSYHKPRRNAMPQKRHNFPGPLHLHPWVSFAHLMELVSKENDDGNCLGYISAHLLEKSRSRKLLVMWIVEKWSRQKTFRV